MPFFSSDTSPSSALWPTAASPRRTCCRSGYPETVIAFQNLGVVPYDDAWQLQRETHARRVAGEIPDTCLLLEHPPVYTAGKRTQDFERPTDGTPVLEVDRGGRITWHGPG